jgi:hypothetical protein
VELLSGPDLGGGFLFQLEAERRPGRAIVRFHAQEGGLEAATPAKGPLTDLGFERHPGACAIGGRECFHREFDVPVEELGRARMTYNRTRFVVGPSLEQRYGSLVPPVREAMTDIAGRLSAAFGGSSEGWFVGGSTSAWIQGVPVAPKDIDLGTDRPGVDRIAEALSDYLIEPPSRTTWPPGRAVYAARAFVGSLVNGVRVEWATAEDEARPAGTATEWGRAPAEVPTEIAEIGGHRVRVARLEFYLAAAARRRDAVALKATAQRLVSLGPNEALLDDLATRLPTADAQRLRSALDAARRSRLEA